MNILLTNDDGIDDFRLATLASIASKLGDVYVVAPDSQKSAVSHCLTIRSNMTLKKVDFPVPVKAAYSLSGTPADCVKSANSCKFIQHFDLVLSGINAGYNMGADTIYSGTVAGAMEAVCCGIPGIAISTDGDNMSMIEEHLLDILSEYIEKPIPETPRGIWNINFPNADLHQYQGVKLTKPATVSAVQDCYKMIELGKDCWEIHPDITFTREFAPGTDFKAVHSGYVSVEPLYLIA